MFGWFNDSSAQSAMAERVHMVTPRTIMQWVDAGEAVIVDVREPNEYAQEHIPGATLLPLSSFDPAAVPDPGDKKLVFHCRSGSRCGMAAARLMATGYAGTVYRMEGGLMNWRLQSGRIETGA